MGAAFYKDVQKWIEVGTYYQRRTMNDFVITFANLLHLNAAFIIMLTSCNKWFRSIRGGTAKVANLLWGLVHTITKIVVYLEYPRIYRSFKKLYYKKNN